MNTCCPVGTTHETVTPSYIEFYKKTEEGDWEYWSPAYNRWEESDNGDTYHHMMLKPINKVLKIKKIGANGECIKTEMMLSDYITHHNDFREACVIARDRDGDGEGYWQHQIDTLDKLAEDYPRNI